MSLFNFRNWLRRGRAAQRTRARTTLRLEELESRLVPYAITGNAWPHPELITISFVPDGTVLGSNSSGPIASNLFATFNSQFGSTAKWENAILKAAQTWAQQTNINFAVVADNGSQAGSGNYEQGDPGMGDIRIGGYNIGNNNILAQTFQPPPIDNYSIAGDMQFNTAMNFSGKSGYDLYTVALHELGHALGLGHSTLQGAVMYASYGGAKKGLTADDVSGIQSVTAYAGARAPDQFHQDGANNASFAAASDLSTLIDPIGLNATVTSLSLNNPGNVDYYTFTAPLTTLGTFQVQVQSQGLSLLAPNVTVYAADQSTVLGSASGLGKYGTTLATTINGVTAGQRFYIEVTGADSSVFATGRYALQLNFGAGSLLPVPLPNTATLAGVVKNTGGGISNLIGAADDLVVNVASAASNFLVINPGTNQVDLDYYEVVDTPNTVAPAAPAGAATPGAASLPVVPAVFAQSAALPHAVFIPDLAAASFVFNLAGDHPTGQSQAAADLPAYSALVQPGALTTAALSVSSASGSGEREAVTDALFAGFDELDFPRFGDAAMLS